MRRFASQLLDLLSDLRLRVPTSRPPPSTIDDNTGKSSDQTDRRDVIYEVGEGAKPKESSARLDGLSTFRLRSSQLTSPKSHRSGGKADVVQAKFRQWYWVEGGLVAVKKLRAIKTKKARNEFVHEVEIMAGLSHKNIVKLVGFVEDLENGIAWIVSSWEPNGNIREFLAMGSWEIPERVSLIRDTFEGIKHLHTRQPPICHGDLKSFNVLVSASYRAIITDFGSARAISAPADEIVGDETSQHVQEIPPMEQACPPIHVGAACNQLTLTGPAWSLRWAPPEVVNGACPGLSSDIWAAGWVCWEVMTGNVPFPELNSPGAITLTLIQGEVPSPLEHGQLAQIVALCSLMTDCWAFDPKARLDISRCCNELKWMPSVRPSRVSRSDVVPPIKLLFQMSHMHKKRGDHGKAILLLQQALSLARSSGDPLAAAAALDGLGGIHLLQSDYAQAEQAFTQAGHIYGSIFDHSGRANTMYGLGHVYRAQSKFNKAEDAFTRAQAIYTLIDSDLGRANTLTGLGHVYRYQSKYAQAEDSFVRAQEIHARDGDDHGRANTLLGLGHVYRLQSKYSQAEALYTQAQGIYARIGDDLGRANTSHGLGYVYCLQSRYALAEESYTRALEIYARAGNSHGRANTLHCVGDLCQNQGRDVEAGTHYSEARDIYARLGIAGDFEDVSRWQAGVSPH